VTRYGGGAQGLARSKAATLTMLALPGSAYLYQGQELGLPEVNVPVKDREDPAYFRGAGPGRDGCRVPLPWSGTSRPYGFSPDGAKPWLPQPTSWRGLSVAAQEAKPGSTLNFFRTALAKRREVVPGLGDTVSFVAAPAGVLAFEREPGFVCVLNCSKRPVRLSSIRPHDATGEGGSSAGTGEVGDLVIASGKEKQLAAGVLPPDTSAWFSPR
jgi:alpha-glucosidase